MTPVPVDCVQWLGCVLMLDGSTALLVSAGLAALIDRCIRIGSIIAQIVDYRIVELSQSP
jgi:hypothetical protein